MTIECTFSIIKPNAVAKNLIGTIIHRFESSGLNIIGAKMLLLTQEQVEYFYAEHRSKPFFKDLLDFMISGPIVVQVLQGEGAICHNREIMGATNPSNALAGTLRADYADSVIKNAVHGSNSTESAAREISYFFLDSEIYTRVS